MRIINLDSMIKKMENRTIYIEIFNDIVHSKSIEEAIRKSAEDFLS